VYNTFSDSTLTASGVGVFSEPSRNGYGWGLLTGSTLAIVTTSYVGALIVMIGGGNGSESG